MGIGPAHDIDQTKIGFPYSNNPYWKMVKFGKINELLKAFQNGDIDCYQIIQQSSRHTIVHQAIVLNRNQVFKLCQIYGADWNQPDANGLTPLMKAAGLNREHYVEKLIQLGVKVDTKDHRGRTAADYARLYDHHDLADQLEQKANV